MTRMLACAALPDRRGRMTFLAFTAIENADLLDRGGRR